jgi:hypothetical protein
MSKVNELIYDVREAISQLQDDSEISDRYIMYLFGLKRSKYLRQDLNNLQKTVDLTILQTLCLELEEVNVNECGLDLDCETIVRTKQKLPKLLELHLKSAIISIKPAGRLNLPFSFVTKERAVFSKHSPFKNNIFAFLDNDNHIYLVSESESVKLIECITVTGIFDNPLDLENYTNCCGCKNKPKCFDFDNTEYPIQSHHIDAIREEIVQMLIRKLQLPEDKINNADEF